MAAKFTRTITYTTAHVKAIDKKTLDVIDMQIPLPDYYEDCDKALKPCQKIAYANNPDVVVLNVVGLVQNTNKYEMTLDTFLKYATKIEE